MKFESILFLCVANSARSQMAEGLARSLFGEAVRVQSAGSEPTTVNPHAVAVMSEVGIDIGGQTSKSVTTVSPDDVDLVVTLCADEVCPPLLSNAPRLHWPLPDPATVAEQERLNAFRRTRDQLAGRLEVLAALRGSAESLKPLEFHASLRVPSLPEAARFYAWLLGESPKEWTHRYVTFVSERLRTNFVVVVADEHALHHDTLYHLGIDIGSREAVIDAHHRAAAAGWTIHKPARTTWRGTPLHELWLKDPGGNLIEIYARLTEAELAEMPANMEPVFLVS